MPKLNFEDVFLPEKEDVLQRINQSESQARALTYFLVANFVEKGIRTLTIKRENFLKSLEEANLSEPINMIFTSDGEYLTITIE